MQIIREKGPSLHPTNYQLDMTFFLRSLRIVVMFSLLTGLGACSQYQKILKSNDNELKYAKAIEFYEKGNYTRTIALLTDIIPAFRGTARAETINYYYAMAHYKQKDYILASHYFRSFATAFPQSRYVEEFLFLSAYSKYLESPRPSLDQTPTLEAIRELQAFINRYPLSDRVEEANSLIDELRVKLETKRFDKGMTYMRIGDYTAAITVFESLIRDFPDTRLRESALLNMMQSQMEYANLSIPERQIERYQEVVNTFQRLRRQFPESELMPQAERIQAQASRRLEQLRPETGSLTN